jgi:hypothetical protein
VVLKLRYRSNRASNTTPQQLRPFAVERLSDVHVATIYHHELEAKLSGASEREPLSLNDKGNVRNVNEEKNDCKVNAIQR